MRSDETAKHRVKVIAIYTIVPAVLFSQYGNLIELMRSTFSFLVPNSHTVFIQKAQMKTSAEQ
jgi:hypothetical protein